MVPWALLDRHTAVLVVDVQNDFADPAGSLFVPRGTEVLGPINALLERARSLGATVVYTQDWHPPRTPHFQLEGGPWPVHCVRDTWGARLHPGLERLAEALVIRKGTGGEDGYSGFSVRDPRTGQVGETGLEGRLRERGIRRVLVAGLATDYCVKETALDALRLGFETWVVRDAVRAVEVRPGDGERALAALEAAGAHLVEVGQEAGGLDELAPGP